MLMERNLLWDELNTERHAAAQTQVKVIELKAQLEQTEGEASELRGKMKVLNREHSTKTERCYTLESRVDELLVQFEEAKNELLIPKQQVETLQKELLAAGQAKQDAEERHRKKLDQTLSSMHDAIQICRNLEDLIRPEISCQYCFEVMTNACVLFPCGHSFCDACVDKMEREHDRQVVCYDCKTVLPRADTAVNQVVNGICNRYDWWSRPIRNMVKMFRGLGGEAAVRRLYAQVHLGNQKAQKLQVQIAKAIRVSKTTSVADTFGQWDADGGGSIDYNELKAGLRSIGVTLANREFNTLVGLLDPTNGGEVDFFTFAAFVKNAEDVLKRKEVGMV